MTREEKQKAIDALKISAPVRVMTKKEFNDYILTINQVMDWLEQEPILDKIRAEIEQLRLHKAQFLTNDNKVCIDSQEVLDILDKYKAETEAEDGNDN